MFWKYNGPSAQIDIILCKEDVTLHELLDHEELLQEVKAQNGKVIEFLLREEVIDELVSLITTEPSEDVDMKEQYKYPNIACELLTSDLPAFKERLVANENVLEKLYNFLDSEFPLNPLLASYFSRTLTILLSKKGEQNWYSYQMTCLQALEFLKAKEKFVELLLRHIGTSAVMDLTLNLVTLVEGPELKQNCRDWLLSKNIIPSLISLLSPVIDSDRQNNAAQVLCDIICKLRYLEDSEMDPILMSLESANMVSFLLDTILNTENLNETSITGGILVLIEILRPYTALEPRCRHILLNSIHDNETDSFKTSPDISRTDSNSEDALILNNIINGILPYVPHLYNVLRNPPKKPAIKLTSGIIDPPFGKARLIVAKLLTVLVGLNNVSIDQEIIQCNIMKILLELFFKYPWNNFLHTEVEKCVSYTLDGCSCFSSVPEVCLFKHLLEECQLFNRILEALEALENDQLQRGYMGHLIRICSVIYLEDKKNLFVQDMIKTLVNNDMLEKWHSFTTSYLCDIIKLHSMPLGGIHPKLLPSESESYEDMKSMPSMENDMKNLEGITNQVITFPDDDNKIPIEYVTGFTSIDNENCEDEEQLTKQAKVFENICAQKWHSISKDLNNWDNDDKIFAGSSNVISWNEDDPIEENKPFPDLQDDEASDEDPAWAKIGNAANPWANGFSNDSPSDSTDWAKFEENFTDNFYSTFNGIDNNGNQVSSNNSTSPIDLFENQFGTIGEKTNKRNETSSSDFENGNDQYKPGKSDNICGSLFAQTGTFFVSTKIPETNCVENEKISNTSTEVHSCNNDSINNYNEDNNSNNNNIEGTSCCDENCDLRINFNKSKKNDTSHSDDKSGNTNKEITKPKEKTAYCVIEDISDSSSLTSPTTDSSNETSPIYETPEDITCDIPINYDNKEISVVTSGDDRLHGVLTDNATNIPPSMQEPILNGDVSPEKNMQGQEQENFEADVVEKLNNLMSITDDNNPLNAQIESELDTVRPIKEPV